MLVSPEYNNPAVDYHSLHHTAHADSSTTDGITHAHANRDRAAIGHAHRNHDADSERDTGGLRLAAAVL